MITDEHFIDWESSTFGFGYGTGEHFTIPIIMKFFEMCTIGDKGGYPYYDYRELEQQLGCGVTWLLINYFCRENVIEYGTSPRFGFLDKKGRLLKEYLEDITVEEVLNIIDTPYGYVHCLPYHCNCGDVCDNPLFNNNIQTNI